MSMFSGGTEVAGTSLPPTQRPPQGMFFRADLAKRVFLPVFALLALAVPASAMTGRELYGLCLGSLGSTDHVMCTLYIDGVTDDLNAGIRAVTSENVLYCPRDATVGDGIDAFIVWAAGNPKSLGRNASLAIAAALVDAYPCGGTK